MANTPIETIFPKASQLDALNAIMQTIAGKIGVAATIQIVRADTLSPDEPVSVTETPESTESNRKYVIGVPAGPAGAAAGFGMISATATQLASGEQPTFQVEWSGPNTEKNLKMSLGVPEGKPGKDGTTPTIGENGNWFLGEIDTEKPARGPAYALTPEDKQAIVQDVLAALPNAEGVGF